jgi:hypothetical protein
MPDDFTHQGENAATQCVKVQVLTFQFDVHATRQGLHLEGIPFSKVNVMLHLLDKWNV